MVLARSSANEGHKVAELAGWRASPRRLGGALFRAEAAGGRSAGCGRLPAAAVPGAVRPPAWLASAPLALWPE